MSYKPLNSTQQSSHWRSWGRPNFSPGGPRRSSRVCGSCGVFRTMNRVASAPSCSAFIHRVALEEVSGHWVLTRFSRPSHRGCCCCYCYKVPSVMSNSVQLYPHGVEQHGDAVQGLSDVRHGHSGAGPPHPHRSLSVISPSLQMRKLRLGSWRTSPPPSPPWSLRQDWHKIWGPCQDPFLEKLGVQCLF